MRPAGPRAAAAALVTYAALGAAYAPATAAAADPYAPGAARATIAQVLHPTVVRDGPGSGRTTGRVGTEASWGGGPLRLLVLRSATDDGGRRWLQVRLPDRPNDRSGWILFDRTRVSSTPWHVVVSRSRRTLSVLRAGELVRRFRVVVGAPATPTPLGTFAVSEPIRQRSGPLGPWALHLTAHSDVLDDYGGGPGRVAIHGRSGALLRDPLGSARSHGCIRMENDALVWLARRAPAGTPVDVRR